MLSQSAMELNPILHSIFHVQEVRWVTFICPVIQQNMQIRVENDQSYSQKQYISSVSNNIGQVHLIVFL